MSFSDGAYFITTSTGSLVNRSPIEDLSLRPKQVIILPEMNGFAIRPWHILSDGKGGYVMRAGGSPTTCLDGRLHATLLDYPEPTSWKFNRIPAAGDNAYTIIVSGSSQGWVAPQNEPYTQIAIEPLTGGNNAREVFIIKPAGDA